MQDFTLEQQATLVRLKTEFVPVPGSRTDYHRAAALMAAQGLPTPNKAVWSVANGPSTKVTYNLDFLKDL